MKTFSTPNFSSAVWFYLQIIIGIVLILTSIILQLYGKSMDMIKIRDFYISFLLAVIAIIFHLFLSMIFAITYYLITYFGIKHTDIKNSKDLSKILYYSGWIAVLFIGGIDILIFALQLKPTAFQNTYEAQLLNLRLNILLVSIYTLSVQAAIYWAISAEKDFADISFVSPKTEMMIGEIGEK